MRQVGRRSPGSRRGGGPRVGGDSRTSPRTSKGTRPGGRVLTPDASYSTPLQQLTAISPHGSSVDAHGLGTPAGLLPLHQLNSSPVSAGPLTDEEKESLDRRVDALLQLRGRMEELAEQHRAEEQSVVAAMRHLLQRTADEDRSRQQIATTVTEFEHRLQQATTEKQQALELYQQFKDQGGGIIQRLSQALTDMQQRYAEEGRRCTGLQREVMELQQDLREVRSRHASLEHQLASAHLAQQAASSRPGPELASPTHAGRSEQVARLEDLVREKDARIVQLEGQLAEFTTAAMRGAGAEAAAALQRVQREAELDRERHHRVEATCMQQIQEYAKLLEEEERLLAQAEAANAQLQREKAELSRRVHPRDVPTPATPSADGPPEDEEVEAQCVVKELLRTPRAPSRPEPSATTSARAQSLLQHSVVRMLVQQLKAEKRQRLETEEQSSRFLAETGRTVASLEARLQQSSGVFTPRPSRVEQSPVPGERLPDPSAVIESDLAEAEALLSARGESAARSSSASPPADNTPTHRPRGAPGNRSFRHQTPELRPLRELTCPAGASFGRLPESVGSPARSSDGVAEAGRILRVPSAATVSRKRSAAMASPAARTDGSPTPPTPDAVPAARTRSVKGPADGGVSTPPLAAAPPPSGAAPGGGLLQRLRRHVQSPAGSPTQQRLEPTAPGGGNGFAATKGARRGVGGDAGLAEAAGRLGIVLPSSPAAAAARLPHTHPPARGSAAKQRQQARERGGAGSSARSRRAGAGCRAGAGRRQAALRPAVPRHAERDGGYLWGAEVGVGWSRGARNSSGS
eukprot:TRINITY_DN6528_c2_g1_i1.p1 TRINITY_DN6528_c2_g1~~TRINITY_DN6528_c2_g1_i1.p1  ORF type:complete len:805 (+),score=284.77 TRINITY_DN6528_c2_g1_i1:98-2512(+)